MHAESGQATIEWTALLLLVALALVGLSRLAPKPDDQELSTTLAQSVIEPAKRTHRPSPRPPSLHVKTPPQLAATAPVRLPKLPSSLRRAGRGAGAVWRRAWFACLVYERGRYALQHPESRIPGYTLPYGTAIRMVNNCVSPVDLVRDFPTLDPAP